jgi:hypothetical protein
MRSGGASGRTSGSGEDASTNENTNASGGAANTNGITNRARGEGVAAATDETNSVSTTAKGMF